MNKKRVLIIAEAGVNHNGDYDLACKMIRAAADAGADFIKFQTFKTESLVSVNAKKAAYQKEALPGDESQFQMLKKLELSYEIFEKLKEECKKNQIGFLSTAFDYDSVNFLNRLEIPFFKIPSGEITNYPYLHQIAQFKKPILLSTGMATLEEIQSALHIFLDAGISRDEIIVLHCSTEYPTPFPHVNLNAMKTLEDKLNIRIGYSDHTLGIEVAIAAVALGAQVIEKHFTLDKNMSGPDHKASLNAEELKSMIQAIRNIESSMGDGEKTPSPVEIQNRIAARKSIVALKVIRVGDVFTEDNITSKRPGNGLSPMKWRDVLGKKAKKQFNPDDLIEL